MIVVFGANGKTGIEVVKEAMRRGLDVRPVTKNDHDTHRLNKLWMSIRSRLLMQNIQKPSKLSFKMLRVSYLASILEQLDYGAPEYTPDAGANIIEVASQHNITKMLHVSVMGGYRWSPNPLNRQTFHMDIRIRRLKVPWTMLRVSCYHDEIEDGHVRPPDGGKPHPFHPLRRYSQFLVRILVASSAIFSLI